MTGGSDLSLASAIRTGVLSAVPRQRVDDKAERRLSTENAERADALGESIREDETALMRSAGHGDASACRILVDRHLRSIVGFAYRFLGDFAEAEDVAQETFFRLWRHAHRWEDRARLTTWLHRVARNLCIDLLRKKRPEAVEDIADHADPAKDQAAALRRDSAARHVIAALAGLPERQRAAVALTHYQGLSNIESAEVMGVSVEALESLLSRARRGLRDRLMPLRDDLIGDL